LTIIVGVSYTKKYDCWWWVSFLVSALIYNDFFHFSLTLTNLLAIIGNLMLMYLIKISAYIYAMLGRIKLVDTGFHWQADLTTVCGRFVKSATCVICEICKSVKYGSHHKSFLIKLFCWWSDPSFEASICLKCFDVDFKCGNNDPDKVHKQREVIWIKPSRLFNVFSDFLYLDVSVISFRFNSLVC